MRYASGYGNRANYLPTPAEIEAMCAAIQKEWTPYTAELRRCKAGERVEPAGDENFVRARWTPPVVRYRKAA